ncbi:MAG: class I SAM-dependent methyltransferase [Solirubrobacterales bacterium]|nr:class I SAM-dependent methyltransferase [Solirubrobacterales bacterium]
MGAAGPDECPWCGRPLHGAARGPLLVCARCGVGVTVPWPTDAELDAAYAGPYRPAEGRFSGPGDAVLRRSRARLAARLDALAPPGPVLDVGAGDGTLVRALRARGRDAVGLERGDEEPAGPFAAIVLWHSLEHLRAPGAALDDAAAKLVPGGVLAVAAPNLASLQARAFGARWLAFDLPRHLVHVPAAELVARLRAAGLEVRRVSHWRGGQVVFGWLHGLVERLAGVDLYDAIRRPDARMAPLAPGRRALALAAGCALLPVALACAAVEVAARRGGSVYVEAVRA